MAESKYWNRFWRRRISRRTLLGAGAVTAVGVAGAVVVGCNGDDGGSGGTQTTPRSGSPVPVGSPQPGGTLTQGRLIEAGGIDPHIDLTGFGIIDLMYTYLYPWRRVKLKWVASGISISVTKLFRMASSALACQE